MTDAPDDNPLGFVDRRSEDERQKRKDESNGQTSWPLPDPDYVRERLSLGFWHTREMPPLNPLLGELVTTTSRILIVGPTGLGKTNFLTAAAMAMADGCDFLHWRGYGRPRRILYIDGEMSRRLFKQRLADAVRRHGSQPATFFAFSREDFPDMPPLDTEAGQKYIDSVIEALDGVDGVVFDNIQALTIGIMKDEEGWKALLPWIRELTQRGIGQIWVHHTGHDETHGYGTKTREWQLDTVGLMERVDRPETDIAFTLNFKFKARERTPDNRSDFEPVRVILADDAWSSEQDSIATKTRSKKKAGDRAFELLGDEIARHGEIPPANFNIPPDTPCITEELWRQRCEAGMISEGSATALERAIRRAQKTHLDAGRIGKHKPWVWIVKGAK